MNVPYLFFFNTTANSLISVASSKPPTYAIYLPPSFQKSQSMASTRFRQEALGALIVRNLTKETDQDSANAATSAGPIVLSAMGWARFRHQMMNHNANVRKTQVRGRYGRGARIAGMEVTWRV